MIQTTITLLSTALDPQGPAVITTVNTGFQGPKGDQGPPGDGSYRYQHVQSVAATTWTVNHNLGSRPNVGVYSSGGVEVVAEVVHASDNQVLVYFDAAFAGLAICT